MEAKGEDYDFKLQGSQLEERQTKPGGEKPTSGEVAFLDR